MKVVHVTGTINHLVIEDMAVAMRRAGMSCALISPRPERLLGRSFTGGDHLILPELQVDQIAENPGAAGRALHGALGGLKPELVVFHDIAHVQLLNDEEPFRTALVLHTVLCSGGKLFRRTDRVCRHPIGYRCLVDWYLGPCGTAADPRIAFDSLRRASAYQSALEVTDQIWVLSRYMAQYLSAENPKAPTIRILDPRFLLSPSPSELPAPTGHSLAKRSGLVFAGRLTYEKGLLPLLDAMALLPDIELRIFGEGYLQGEVALRAERLPNVSVGPFLDREELPAEFARARGVVVPSLWPEPLGMVPFEALQCGAPVLVSSRGGLPEWAEFFDSGVTVLQEVSAPLLAAEIRQANERPRPVVPLVKPVAGRMTIAHAAQELCK